MLTTHSMEEADILGDRIGIMVRGKLRCIGSSLRLKSRFGSGYRVSVRIEGKDNIGGVDQQVTHNEMYKERIRELFVNRLGVKSGAFEKNFWHHSIVFLMCILLRMCRR